MSWSITSFRSGLVAESATARSPVEEKTFRHYIIISIRNSNTKCPLSRIEKASIMLGMFGFHILPVIW